MSFGRRYAHRIRAVVVCSCALLAVPAMPVDSMPAAAAIAAGMLAWSLAHYRIGAAGRRPRLLLVADVAVLTGLCLSQALTIPASQTQHGSTWVLVAVSIVAVSYQLMYPAPLALALALYLAAADLAGAVLDRPDGWAYALPNAGWLLVQSSLAQGLYRLVLRSSRTADAAAARTAAARRGHEVAQAQRSAEREYLATLHDTACATLLMVAVRGESIPGDVLRRQAAKDLRQLAAERVTTGESEVADELREEIAGHPLRVRAEFADGLGSAWGPAVVALRGGVAEALRNVALHSGVGHATVRAERVGDRVTVTVGDDGAGFDVTLVPAHCRGLAWSVVERMSSVGGRATVDSAPGRGTTVRLEWPYV
ncbi:ATP-binding protein [Streptomyces sp. NPDC050617]|uniref:sensor histidine kinase n=1 Tax=Streptomyces sp. NPDC050617 TaxID=3154628 RepID=UPI003442AF39